MGGGATQIEANKSVVERHFRAFDEKNYDLMESVTAPDMVHHATSLLPSRSAASTRGPQDPMRDPFLFLLAAFPDISFEIKDLVGEGDKVVARVRQRGTQRWKFQGLAPTDHVVDVQQIHMFRITNGRTSERWVARQDLLMMEQLGVVESSGPPTPDDEDAADRAFPTGQLEGRAWANGSEEERKATIRRVLDSLYVPVGGRDAELDGASRRRTVSLRGPGFGAVPLPFGPRDDTLPFLRAAFPDLVMSVEDLLADGDRVAALVRVRGTNTRAAHGFEATGRAIDLHHIHAFGVADTGTLTWWPGRDDLALAIQLGIFIPPRRAEQAGWLGAQRTGAAERGTGGRAAVTAPDVPAG